MDIHFRNVKLEDKDFILKANREINVLSGLNDSTLDNNIDKDLFKDKLCKCISAEENTEAIGFVLYRKKGILKLLLNELEEKERNCNFITDFVGKENEVMNKSQGKLNFKSSDLIIYYRLIKKRDDEHENI